jgi:hypothetical protein
MPGINVLRHEPVSLRGYGINEDWVQRYIAEDPSRLGLGQGLTLLTRERRQARAGRLDILLANRDAEPEQRYEVEVQLGATDESHIIRSIEYWDIERKDHPHYEHVAVLVAEDITNRFFNVIQLFNGHIPIIAIKMIASKLEAGLILQFVTVLNASSQSVEEEEERAAPVVNREWWEKASSRESMQVVDSLSRILAEFDERVQLYYTQGYIRPQFAPGDRLPVWINPKKKFVRVGVHLADQVKGTEWKTRLDEAGLEAGSKRPGDLWFELTPDALQGSMAIVSEILKETTKGE